MRILIIGAGSVSGYFGARLAQHGRDVTFLVRAQRAEQLRRGGLRVSGVLGDFAISPSLTSAEELRAAGKPYDLVILGVKAYSLLQAMDDFEPAVGPGTTILPLLNGMGHLEVLAERFGAGAVIGGLTRIVADLAPDGSVAVFETLHDITFGELDHQVTSRVQGIEATLSGCGFETELSTNILAAMWFKWVLLSSVGAITLLGRGTIGEINRAPGGRELALGVFAEALAIAEANGSPLPAKGQKVIHRRLTATESAFVSSLYRDLHKGSAVEADHVFGDLIRRAAAHGVAAPLLSAAYTQAKVYEAGRRAAAAPHRV